MVRWFDILTKLLKLATCQDLALHIVRVNFLPLKLGDIGDFLSGEYVKSGDLLLTQGFGEDGLFRVGLPFKEKGCTAFIGLIDGDAFLRTRCGCVDMISTVSTGNIKIQHSQQHTRSLSFHLSLNFTSFTV